jgi:hypothetical protein
MFVGKVEKEITVGDGTLTIRKLSAKKLQKARDARSLAQAEGLKVMGGDVLKAMFRSDEAKALSAERPKLTPEEERKAFCAAHDRGVILTLGIVSWSWGPLPDDPLDFVDDETADEIHRTILDYAVPPKAAEVPKGDA